MSQIDNKGKLDTRRKLLIGGGVVAFIVFVVVLAGQLTVPKTTSRAPDMQMVRLAPIPRTPQPTPPPQPTPELEQKVEEMKAAEQLDEAPPDEAPQPAAPDAGTGIVGNGPADGFGLTGRAGGSGFGSGRTGGGSKLGYFQGQFKRRIQGAFEAHPVLSRAVFDDTVRIWLSPIGRVERVRIPPSATDKKVRKALREEIMRLTFDPPPEGTQMPITWRARGAR